MTWKRGLLYADLLEVLGRKSGTRCIPVPSLAPSASWCKLDVQNRRAIWRLTYLLCGGRTGLIAGGKMSHMVENLTRNSGRPSSILVWSTAFPPFLLRLIYFFGDLATGMNLRLRYLKTELVSKTWDLSAARKCECGNNTLCTLNTVWQTWGLDVNCMIKPTCVRELQTAMGSSQYICKSMPQVSNVNAPLSKMNISLALGGVPNNKITRSLLYKKHHSDCLCKSKSNEHWSISKNAYQTWANTDPWKH